MGPLTSNSQVKTPLGQGSLSPIAGYGNPEGLDSRESKPCRDFLEEDWVTLPIKSKYGVHELKISRTDLDLVSKGLGVVKQRTRGGHTRYVPTASKNGWYGRNSDCRFVYIMVVEKSLGRPLKKSEVVHHINGDPFDCRRENLIVMKRAEHSRIHIIMSVLYAREHFQSSSGGDQFTSLVKEVLGRNTRSIRGIYQVI